MAQKPESSVAGVAYAAAKAVGLADACSIDRGFLSLMIAACVLGPTRLQTGKEVAMLTYSRELANLL